MKIVIGTRGSQLALAQAGQTVNQMMALLPEAEIHLEVIKTIGDGLSADDAPGGPLMNPPRGIFTKELDEALLSGKIRAAIHSLKDVPTQLPPDVVMGLYLKREDYRDAFVSKNGKSFFEIPAGSRVGTSSPRREAQIKAIRSDVIVVPLRGNVDTRMQKLQREEVEAIVLAAAGLKRLGRLQEATELLGPEIMLPSPAQGVLGVTWRFDDHELKNAFMPLNDLPTEICAKTERAFLKTLQGGCRIPVGALASIDGVVLSLSGVVAHPSGEQIMRNSLKGHVDHPVELGEELGKMFLNNGAQEILNSFGRSNW